MNIFVLGSNGMLGRYVSTFLSKENNVINLTRNELDAQTVAEEDITNILVDNKYSSGDVIVNCIGMIKPQVDKLGTVAAIKVNSLFPHSLANVGEKIGAKVIHITTDCVFSGNKGNYTEEDQHDVTDVYGRTKSLGEPKNGMTIRTSIIGEEIEQSRSLVEWIKSMKDKEVNGFVNHHWNGVTCLQLAKVIGNIISVNLNWKGIKHIHTPDTVNKEQLVNMISDIYDLNITVNPVDADEKIDRTLSSIYDDDYIHNFGIPNLKEQIQEMKKFEIE